MTDVLSFESPVFQGVGLVGIIGVSLRLIFIPFVLVVTSRKPFIRLHFPSQLPFIANYTKQVNTKH